MKKHLLIQILILTILISACSTKKTVVTSGAELKLDQASPSSVAAAQTLPNGDQIISTSPVSGKSWKSQPKMSWAGTTVVEMHDGFGNKIENRSFPNHSLITTVVVRTPAKGEQTIEVYGRNGELRKLPADKINLALQGTNDEIAAVAGITNIKDSIVSESNTLSQTEAQSTTQNSNESSTQPLNSNLNKEQPIADLNHIEPQTAITGAQVNPSDKTGKAN